jgi:anti-sigma B factor antagonist
MQAVGETQTDPSARSIFVIAEHQLAADTTVLSVEGDLDLSSAPDLKWALGDLQASGARHIVVDLAKVSFIDSTALGVLVGAQRALDQGIRMAVACRDENVLRIFELTGLDCMFEIVGTVEEALEYVQGRTTAAG